MINTGINLYVFYWHTGRDKSDDPEKNDLIVYELSFTGNTLEGIYYFPIDPSFQKTRVLFFM